MPTILVNPMSEASVEARSAPPRLATLAGRTIALLDISKPGGDLFLDRLERLLRERMGVAAVVREKKPTFTRPAPPELLERIRRADAVVEALAD